MANNTPTNGDDFLLGSALFDSIDGLGGNDFIQGGGGGDLLIGGTGNDALWSAGNGGTYIGGLGDDSYVLNQDASAFADLTGFRDETVIENSGAGTDKALSYGTLDMTGDLANVENLRLVTRYTWDDNADGTFTGVFKTLAVNGVGNALDNTMESNGTTGSSLAGGAGNDTYIERYLDSDSRADSITEVAGEGTDTIMYTPLVAGQSYHLPDSTNANAQIEGLTFGGALAINGYGNALDNTFTGNNGVNTFFGGAGDDLYILQTITDKAIENVGEGTKDTIECPFTISLLTLPNIENVFLNGTGNVNATGNTTGNTLAGNGGNNILDGGVGTADTDTFFGNGGNDTYLVNNSTDIVLDSFTFPDMTVASLDNGTDLILANLANGQTYDMHLNAIMCENLTLTGLTNSNATGNDQNNVLTGNAGNNILDGGAGGYNGSTNTGSEGNDSLLGGAGNDTLYSSGGTCRMDGGLGADTMFAGIGNDYFYVDNAGDYIMVSDTLTFIGGIDGISSTVTFDMNLRAANTGETALTLIGALNINAIGNDLGDTLTGNTGMNLIVGGAGVDTIVGGGGNDRMNGNGGDDTITGGGGNDTIDGGGANDTLYGLGSVDTISGGAGNDTLDGGQSYDTLIGGDGDDVYLHPDIGDHIIEGSLAGSGTDLIIANVSYSIASLPTIENLTINSGVFAIGNGAVNVVTGNGAANTLQGGGSDDTLIGMGGNDTMDGGTGADTMTGLAGNDTFIVDDVNDKVTGGGPFDHDLVLSSVDFDLTVTGTDVEGLTLTGTTAVTATGNALDNIITGNNGAATVNILTGLAGDDTYMMDNTADTIVEAALGGTKDTVISTVSFDLSAAPYAGQEIENLTLTGLNAVTAVGNALDNIITALDPKMINSLDGGAGNDTYVIDATDSQFLDVIATDSAGIDTIKVNASYSIQSRTDLDNIFLTGTGNWTATGNSIVNVLTGNNVGNNILDAGSSGGLGDTYVGSSGNDTYMVDEAADTVIQDLGSVGPDSGTDLIIASVDYDMNANAMNVENLTLTGSAIVGKGNALSNVLTGDTQGNTLIGLGGNDIFHDVAGGGLNTFDGGTGNDTFFVSLTTDTIIEAGGEGVDTVLASVNYDMSAYATGEVEILTLTGLALVGIGNGTNNTITGNGGINTIHGGGGNDTIDGGAGADTMYGDAGDDTFIVDSLLDVVIETAGGGTADLIKAGFTYTLGDSSQPNNQVENLTLTGIAKINGTGNALANIITGNGAVNTLDGGLGADTYNGGGGYDTYMADIGGDTVLSGAGIVWASASYDMGAQAISIADLKMLAGCTVGTGNALANNIYTNNGICTVNGGAGNDTIYLHNDQDVVLDANAGVPETDTIIIDTTSYVTSGPGTASYDMSLYATGVRALTITGGGAFNVTCGDLPGGGPSPVPMGVTITGNSGVNTIMGGSGDDTFFVDAKDFVSGTGGGSDTVAVSFTLSLLADQALAVSHWVGIENITLTGSLIGNLTGDLLVNTLTGNAGTNIINDGGYGGALFAGDTLIGGGGNDTYYVNNTSDIVDEQHNGGGLDLVISTVSFDMSGTVSDSVDRLTLTGSALYGIGNSSTNTITGNALDNTIDGGAGSDTMIGGLGSDTYYVDSSDTIIDSGGLHDLVIVQKASYILPTGIEDATLEPGIIATSLTGNSAVNVLIGNTLDNMIDGKLGADTMIGGDGNDNYFVDNLGDVVTEQIGEGTDQITTTINYSLASIANVENLEVHDPARIGYGNALDNHIFSCGCTAAANTLAGNAGSDWLEGKTGNDILYAENAPGQPVVTDSAFDINTLDGGLGKDTLYCGQGIDTVVCNPDATTNVDIVYNFQKSGGDNILFESALIGFDPLQNVLDDFVAHRQVSANLEYVYIDRDGIGNAYHFQLALILNEIP